MTIQPIVYGWRNSRLNNTDIYIRHCLVDAMFRQHTMMHVTGPCYQNFMERSTISCSIHIILQFEIGRQKFMVTSEIEQVRNERLFLDQWKHLDLRSIHNIVKIPTHLRRMIKQHR